MIHLLAYNHRESTKVYINFIQISPLLIFASFYVLSLVEKPLP